MTALMDLASLQPDLEPRSLAGKDRAEKQFCETCIHACNETSQRSMSLPRARGQTHNGLRKASWRSS